MKKLVGAAPWIFILIWSSGFVVAKYAFADADALFFLAIRLILAAGILFLLTAALRQPLRLSRSDMLRDTDCLDFLYTIFLWHAFGLPSR